MKPNPSSSPLGLTENDFKGDCLRPNRALALLQEQIAAIKQSAQAPASAAIAAPNVATTTETDSVQGAGELTTLGAIPKVIAPGELGQSSLNDNGTAVSTTEKVFVGTNVDDGTVAKLQVHGDVNVPPGSTYLIGGVSIAGTTGFPGSYASFNALGQSGNIASTNIQHSSAVLPSGQYVVVMDLEAVATGSTQVTVTFGWTSPRLGAQTVNFDAVNTGYNAQALPIRTDGAANLTITVAKSGAGTVVYDVVVSVLRLA